MNASKVQESDYIQFLIAAQKVYSCVEAERVSPEVTAHDA
jgi:putative transposase